jgi:FKBP-type peptidyl-prolyl cis-trans isomerases 1
MKKQLWVSVMVSLVVILCSAAFVLAAESGNKEKSAAAEIAQCEKNARKTPSGLKYVVLREGKGDKPRKGQSIEAHYVGRFMDGRVFDQSLGRGPFSFVVGIGQVIKAWDEALMDMRPGEKRALVAPPELAYGSRGAGNVIPPNATLFFEVERLR